MASCSTPSFEVEFNDIANKKAVRFSPQRDFSFHPGIRLKSVLTFGERFKPLTANEVNVSDSPPYNAAFSKIIIEYAFLGYSDFSYLIS